MLSPTRFDKNVVCHIVHKTQLWALRLAEVHFTVEHIPGESNIWADIFSRWANADHDLCSARRIASLIVSLITNDIPDLPSIEVIEVSQLKCPPLKETAFSLTDHKGHQVWANAKYEMYIPADDTELQTRICIAAHSGLDGHRSKSATRQIIGSKVTWPTMGSDVNAFFHSCLSCVISATGQKVPRSLGWTPNPC